MVFITEQAKGFGNEAKRLRSAGFLANSQTQEVNFEQLSEKLMGLIKDPDCFQWPIQDPLRCLAIGIFREHANRFAAGTREEFGMAHDDADDDSDSADW